MARTLDDEERERRIIIVGDYVRETGASTRRAAEFFKRTCFDISNATVSDYCHRYMKMHRDELNVLRGRIDANTVKDVNDEAVRTRVLRNANLLLSGMTVQNISEQTGVSFWTVYRDLTTRLKLVDEELYEKVRAYLTEDKEKNLRHGK